MRVPIYQNQSLQDRSLPGIISPDDQVGTPEVLELDVFEAAKLFQLKGGDRWDRRTLAT